jgi:deoxyribonuclease IV
MVGLHISAAGSLDLAFDRAQEVGADTFQIFTRNPNQWKFKPIAPETEVAFLEKRKASGIRRVVDHMPYLPNLASAQKATMKLSRYTLDEEVKRCDSLGIDYLVTHLGSHLGAGIAVGVRNIADAVNEALAGSRGSTMVLLENTAGAKNSVGSRFEELRLILDKVKKDDRVGVCFDTCHAYAAGFDLGGEWAVSQTMDLFEECVGRERLKVVHLNDAKGALGSNLDRHEFVGRGKIGKKGIRAFLHYQGITDIPLIMETPFEDAKAMKEELKVVRSLLR